MTRAPEQRHGRAGQEGRSLARYLWATWLLLGVAVTLVSGVVALTTRDLLRERLATCPGGLEIDPLTDDDRTAFAPYLPREQEPEEGTPHIRAGYPLDVERSVERIERRDRLADGTIASCGEVFVFEPFVGAVNVRGPIADNRYVLTDVLGEPKAVVITTQTPHRAVLHPRDASLPVPVPMALATVALAALVLGALRARLGVAYALRLHRWPEASLDASGQVTAADGALLASAAAKRMRDLPPPGLVLVTPNLPRAAYRDLPVVTTRELLEGGHDRWWKGTLVRLRDARAIAILASLAATAALVARALVA